MDALLSLYSHASGNDYRLLYMHVSDTCVGIRTILPHVYRYTIYTVGYYILFSWT